MDPSWVLVWFLDVGLMDWNIWHIHGPMDNSSWFYQQLNAQITASNFFDQEKLLKRETHGFLRQKETTRCGIWLDVFVGFIPIYVAPFLSHFWIRDAIHGIYHPAMGVALFGVKPPYRVSYVPDMNGILMVNEYQWYMNGIFMGFDISCPFIVILRGMPPGFSSTTSLFSKVVFLVSTCLSKSIFNGHVLDLTGNC